MNRWAGGPARLRVSLLGPVRAWRDATELSLGPPQRRAVLAVLALAGGRPVSRPELVDLLWPEAPPPRAVNVVQTHMKHLRQLFEPDRPSHARSTVLPSVGTGYALRVDPLAVDALRFRQLVAEARAARRSGDQAGVWRVAGDALRLWRAPVADVPALAEHPSVVALVGQWRVLLGWYADAALALGRADEVLDELEEQARSRPLDEQIQVHLLRAYGALGRRADAFETYDRARRRLASELGVNAGEALTTAYEELLRDSTAEAAGGSADLARPAPPAAAPRPVPPAQLPAAVPDFVGRAEELAALDRAGLDPGGTGRARVVAVVGPPGVGKTALGLRWADAVRERFPDGQLYVDLRGYGGDPPLRPEVVLERFVRTLALPGARVPASADELAPEYRSQLAGRRMLIFLDNAGSADQVAPLLPGGGRSVAVVTSRHRLDGLVALHDAVRVSLGPLPEAEAVELVEHLATRQRADAADRAAVVRLAELCDRLPLALRIAGCRLQPGAAFGVPELATAMADERTRLDQLAVDAGEISVRTVFATWMHTLDPPSRRMLRLLGNHPGPRPSPAACAALADLPVGHAREVLDRLAAAHLVVPAGPDHYGLHDLVRILARERSYEQDSPRDREQALGRLLAWYLDTADGADRVLRPGERPNFERTTEPVAFPDEAAAFAWLDAEAPNLVAAVEQGAATHPRAAWQLAAALFGWLLRCHNRAQWVALYTVAAEAAARAGDASGEATIVSRLAAAHAQLGQPAEAIAACQRAFRIRTAMGDTLGAATSLLNLGAVHLNQGRPEPAIRWLGLAARVGRSAPGATHLNLLLHSNLGEAHRLAGRFPEAAQHYRAGLEAAEAAGASREAAHILVELSRLHHDLGDKADAMAYGSRALDAATRCHDAMLRAEAQECIGRARAAGGDVEGALRYLREALSVYQELGHRDVDRLGALVARLGGGTAPGSRRWLT